MKYDKIHNRFELPLGLYFILQVNHPEYKGKILCKSNIPEIDMLVLESKDIINAIEEVCEILEPDLIANHTLLDYTQIKNQTV